MAKQEKIGKYYIDTYKETYLDIPFWDRIKILFGFPIWIKIAKDYNTIDLGVAQLGWTTYESKNVISYSQEEYFKLRE